MRANILITIHHRKHENDGRKLLFYLKSFPKGFLQEYLYDNNFS